MSDVFSEARQAFEFLPNAGTLGSAIEKLARNGKQANVVTAAIARELAGFVWAIARRVPPAAG